MKSRRQENFERQTVRFKRGLVQFGRMIIFGGITVWATNWLINNEYITYGQIYAAGLPREIPEWGLFAALALVMLVGFELIFFFLYVWIRPSGRRKANHAFVSEKDKNRYQEWG